MFHFQILLRIKAFARYAVFQAIDVVSGWFALPESKDINKGQGEWDDGYAY